MNNQVNLQNLLEEWKIRLGLQDWVIVLEENCSPNDMTLQSCAGETEWTECNKTALVRILSEKDYGNRIVPFNPEKTLIHELLHLKLCLLTETNNDLQNRIVHQYIDDLAKAFIDAKYSDNVVCSKPIVSQIGKSVSEIYRDANLLCNKCMLYNKEEGKCTASSEFMTYCKKCDDYKQVDDGRFTE